MAGDRQEICDDVTAGNRISRAFHHADKRWLDQLHHHRSDRRLDRRQARKGRGSGILMNIVIGIIGALIGGFLLSFWFDTAEGGRWFTLFTAILGSGDPPGSSEWQRKT